MTQQTEIVEIPKEYVDAVISKGEALKRLQDNPDFKAVILDGFLKDEVLRVVSLKADPNFISGSPERVRFIEDRLMATAQLQAHLRELAGEYRHIVTSLNEQAELEAEEDDN